MKQKIALLFMVAIFFMGTFHWFEGFSLKARAADDTTPPAQITTLDATVCGKRSCMLGWFAVADDGSVGDPATSYDVRYSTSPITNDTEFNNATQPVGVVAVPSNPGNPQACNIVDLETETTYYFAIKTTDDEGNTSVMSNTDSETTIAVGLTPPYITVAKPTPTTTKIIDAAGGGDYQTFPEADADYINLTAPVLYRVKSGTYDVAGFGSDGTAGNEIAFEPFGDGKVTIQSNPNGINISGDYVIFDGGVGMDFYFDLTTTNEGKYFQPTGDYVTISRCEITSPNRGSNVVPGSGANGANYFKLYNNYIHDTNGANIYVRSGDYIEIRNNEIANSVGSSCQMNPHEIGESADELVFSGNLSYNFNGGKLSYYGFNPTGVSSDIYLSNNIFFNGGTGNDNASYAIYIAESSLINIRMWNNTVYNARRGVKINGPSPTVDYRNNISVNSRAGVDIANFSYFDTFSNNVDGYDSDDTDPEPSFLSTDTGSSDFLKLKSDDTSSIDLGANLSAESVTIDFWGNTRPQNALYDVGASEYVDGDGIAPSQVVNLSITSCTYSTCTLSWTAVGDDGSTGTATSYDIRYSISNIANDTDFNNATEVTGESSPLAAGQTESLTITGLTEEETYYFTIKVSDEVPNISVLSNVVSDTTASQSWQEELEESFDVVSTFNDLDDWKGEGSSDSVSIQDDGDNFPVKTADGLPSIWQSYTNYGEKTGPDWIQNHGAENVWQGTGKSLIIDYNNNVADPTTRGPSRLGAKLGDSAHDGYQEMHIFFMAKVPRHFLITTGEVADYHEFWKTLDVSAGFETVSRWGTLAERQWLCYNSSDLYCADSLTTGPGDPNCPTLPGQVIEAYGLNAQVYNFTTGASICESEVPKITELVTRQPGEDDYYCKYNGTQTYTLKDCDTQSADTHISITPYIMDQEWFGIEYRVKMSNPHGASNGEYEAWLYDQEGNQVGHHLTTGVVNFKDGNTVFEDHNWNRFVFGGNRAGVTSGFSQGYLGTHNGSSNSATLQDSTASLPADMTNWTIYNLSDGYYARGKVTSNTTTQVTAVLADGSENDWDTGDQYYVVKNKGFGPEDHWYIDDVVVDDSRIGETYFTLLNDTPIPLSITTTTLTDATEAEVFSQTLAATGGTIPYSWEITAGALPAGLSLSTTGTISGTPTENGSFNFTVQITDSTATPTTDTQALTLEVIAADTTAPTILSANSDKTNGTYTIGEVIDIDITFSENVTSTGDVTVTLETGAIDRNCTFTVTSATTGTCNYTVQIGDTTSDLEVKTIAGTINDVSGGANEMVNFVPVTNLAANKAIVIDTTAPTITVNEGTDVGPTADDTINLTASDETALNSSGSEYGFSSDNICNVGDTYGNNFTNSTDFHITTDSTEYLCAKASDEAGNTGYQLVGQLNVADTTAPTILSANSDKTNGTYTIGEVIDIDITFSENVTSTGDVTVTLETGATDRNCTFTVTSATTGTCNYTVQIGDTTSDLEVKTITGTINDVSGSANEMVNFVPVTNLAANKAIVIDTTAPTITVNEGTDVGPTAADTINIAVTDATILEYGYSTDNVCDGADSYGNAIVSDVNFVIMTAHLDYLCIKAADATGNMAYELVGQLNVETTAPILVETTAVTTPSNDTTPDYTFSTDEAGTISYGGSCSSGTTGATSGSNTITMSTLAAGTYNDCTLLVTDAAGNASSSLAISAFTIDVTAPTIAEVTVVTTPSNDTTPNYTFSTDEAGTISYGGSCSSGTTSATSGDNTITLSALVTGTYNDCTLTVTDAAGNVSSSLEITTFIIDTTAPLLNEEVEVPIFTNDTTPTYTFSSDETGTISYSGDCDSVTSSATVGDNIIIFNILTEGLHNNCTLSVTDGVGNESVPLNISAFKIDLTAPTITINGGTETGPVEDDIINLTAVDESSLDTESGLEYGFSVDNVCDIGDIYGNDFISSTDFHIVTDHIDYLCAKASDEAGNVGYQLIGKLNVEDMTAPMISAVSSNKKNDHYREDEVIDIDVTFSENVTSTGNVTVTLETGDTDRTCVFTVVDSNVGTCNYRVQEGDDTDDLNVSAIVGVIKDVSGNANAMVDFSPTTNLAANKAIVIDTITPSIKVENGTSSKSTDDDTIKLKASDETDLRKSSLEYGFSSNKKCSKSDNYKYEFENKENFHITGNNTKYLCAKAKDKAGNTKYKLVGKLNVKEKVLANEGEFSYSTKNELPNAPESLLESDALELGEDFQENSTENEKRLKNMEKEGESDEKELKVEEISFIEKYGGIVKKILIITIGLTVVVIPFGYIWRIKH